MNRIEPCTDLDGHNVRHLSAHLEDLPRGGRVGLALCGIEPRLPVIVYDDEALNRQLREQSPEFRTQPPIVAADLRPCEPCVVEALRRQLPPDETP